MIQKKEKKQSLTKLTLKNSVYNFTATFISKIGGLVFTIIIARMLLPELFGVYNLALSVILVATTFADLGVGTTYLRYVSKALGKNNRLKARSYFRYLFKIKGLLMILVIVIVLIIAKPLAYNIFNKPLIFLPIIFACLYILMLSLRNFFLGLFYALKDLSKIPIIELSLQLFKIIFSLLAILFFSHTFRVSGIFLALTLSAFLSFIVLFFLLGKNKDLIFGRKIAIEKPKILHYLGYTGIAGISLMIFGSIDTLMLGRFVEVSYIGYYRAALGLVLAVAALLAFSGILLPIFTQIHRQRLERGFQKTFRYIIMLAIPTAFGLMFVARYFILAIYGSEYMLSTSSLYDLSFLIITGPLIMLYSTIFQAKEKPKILAKFIIIALLINIILNYVLIKSLLTVNQEYAIIGAGLATLASRIFLFGALSIKAKSQFKLKVKKSPIIKSIIATIAMVLVLALFTYFVDMNLFLGIIEILLGILVYFGVLWLVRGIGKEDFKLLKFFSRR